MVFVVIFGPPAVGKMAVGMALAKKTGIPLFHNHMSIEFVQPFFNYGTPTGRRLVNEFRQRIFQEVAAGEGPGLIFSYVWAFELATEKEYIDSVAALFRARGARVVFLELEALLDARLERNRGDLRLAHKASKRNLSWSEQNLLENERKHRMNTNGDFYYPDEHLKIDNTDLSPEEIAERFIRHFAL